MWIIMLIGVLMVLPMVGDPLEQGTFNCHSPQHRQNRPHRSGRGKRPMRKQPVIPHRDPDPCQQIHPQKKI